MAVSIQTIHQELRELRRNVEIIKAAIVPEGDLTPYAKRALKKARETPESEYVDLA